MIQSYRSFCLTEEVDRLQYISQVEFALLRHQGYDSIQLLLCHVADTAVVREFAEKKKISKMS